MFASIPAATFPSKAVESMLTYVRRTEAFGLHVVRICAERDQRVRHGFHEWRWPAHKAQQITFCDIRQPGQQFAVNPTASPRPLRRRLPRQGDDDVSCIARQRGKFVSIEDVVL